MSTTKASKSRPRRLLDDFPPDTRVVVAGVTWDDYEHLVDDVGEARNCRIAFDGNDIEMMTLGPWHESEKITPGSSPAVGLSSSSLAGMTVK